MTRVRNKAAVSPLAVYPTDPREYLAQEPRRLVAALTDRQRAVLLMLARDFQQKDMAAALGLSIHTVRAHRADLYRALGVQTAVGATVVAFRAGLVS